MRLFSVSKRQHPIGHNQSKKKFGGGRKMEWQLKRQSPRFTTHKLFQRAMDLSFSMFLYEKHTFLLEEGNEKEKEKKKKSLSESKPSPDAAAAVFLNPCVRAAPVAKPLIKTQRGQVP